MAVASAGPINGSWRRWLSWGVGVGVEPAGGDLRIVVTRMRPGGIAVVGETRIQGYEERSAAEWGAEAAAFLRQAEASHAPAVMLAPRNAVSVRTLALPGVGGKDLASAVQFQIDALHPYDEAEAVHCWAKIAGSPYVLVGVSTVSVVQRYAALFAEAGLKLGSVTFSAAALYTAARLYRTPPAEGFLVVAASGEGAELYGESEARPVFSSTYDGATDRTLTMARSELRLDPTAAALSLTSILPPPVQAPEGFDMEASALAYAASLASAAPRWSLPANLLPTDQRVVSSRLAYAPTAVLGLLLAIAAGLMASQSSFQNERYLDRLNAELAGLEKQALRAQELDQETDGIREQIAALDRFRRRSSADIEALRELTALLAPPAWVSNLTLTRTEATVNGQAPQAAPLLEILDKSPLFVNSEFSQSLGRQSGGGEAFTIRASREGAGTGAEPQ